MWCPDIKLQSRTLKIGPMSQDVPCYRTYLPTAGAQSYVIGRPSSPLHKPPLRTAGSSHAATRSSGWPEVIPEAISGSTGLYQGNGASGCDEADPASVSGNPHWREPASPTKPILPSPQDKSPGPSRTPRSPPGAAARCGLPHHCRAGCPRRKHTPRDDRAGVVIQSC